jgi:DNA-binding SARP family transcriptional activator
VTYDSFHFQLLGPLEVRTSTDDPVPLGGSRQESLLAALLLNVNNVMSISRLGRYLWEKPPSTARNQIHMAVSLIRNSFRKFGNWNIIETQPPGYIIKPGSRMVIDAHLFSERVNRGRELSDQGLIDEAVTESRAGLSLWHGEMLEELRSPLLRAQTAKYEERRLSAIEFVMDLELERGRHHEIVEELIELTAAHPLRERLHSQLVTALSRAGRQSEAMTAYCDIHNRLIKGLGLRPGPHLAAAERVLLAGNRSDYLSTEHTWPA